MDLSNTNIDRLYESMNDHALTDGTLEFPMMGWPCCVRNPSRDLTFNDLAIPKVEIIPQKKLLTHHLLD